MRNPTRMFTATVLTFEALVIFFASLVAKDLSSMSTGAALSLFGVLALVLVVAAGVVGRPGGYVVGSVLQVVVLATGFVVGMMFVVGGIFAALWVTSLVVGQRLERERAEIDARATAASSS